MSFIGHFGNENSIPGINLLGDSNGIPIASAILSAVLNPRQNVFRQTIGIIRNHWIDSAHRFYKSGGISGRYTIALQKDHDIPISQPMRRK